MAQQELDPGIKNDPAEDSLWSAFGKIQSMFTELYAALLPAPSYARHSNGITRSTLNSNVVLYTNDEESSGSAFDRPINANSEYDCHRILMAGIYAISINNHCAVAGRAEIRSGTVVDNTSDDAKTLISFMAWGAGYPEAAAWMGFLSVNDLVWIFSAAAPAANRYDNQLSITGPL